MQLRGVGAPLASMKNKNTFREFSLRVQCPPSRQAQRFQGVQLFTRLATVGFALR